MENCKLRTDIILKAMVLKQYVDYVKEILSRDYIAGEEKEFLEWFEVEGKRFGLKKEMENMEKILKLLKEIEEKPSKKEHKRVHKKK